MNDNPDDLYLYPKSKCEKKTYNWLKNYGMQESDVDIMTFTNIPYHTTYLYHKPSQEYYECKIIIFREIRQLRGQVISTVCRICSAFGSTNPPILVRVKWRCVTYCFDWSKASKENKLPVERNIIMEIYYKYLQKKVLYIPPT